MQAVYKRIVLKISGEALAGEKGMGYDRSVLNAVVDQIVTVCNLGVQVGIVVGGGNFWRGRQGLDMDRATADYMGMLATAMNALCLQEAIESRGISARVQTALSISRVAEPYSTRSAISHLENGSVVIFGCGTGSPFFSTDTAAALRAAEINAQAILLAKNVDGIYDSDPKINENAKKYDSLSYMDFIKGDLKAMDTTAVTMCKENGTPVFAFALYEKDSIVRAVCGDNSIGTWIK